MRVRCCGVYCGVIGRLSRRLSWCCVLGLRVAPASPQRIKQVSARLPNFVGAEQHRRTIYRSSRKDTGRPLPGHSDTQTFPSVSRRHHQLLTAPRASGGEALTGVCPVVLLHIARARRTALPAARTRRRSWRACRLLCLTVIPTAIVVITAVVVVFHDHRDDLLRPTLIAATFRIIFVTFALSALSTSAARLHLRLHLRHSAVRVSNAAERETSPASAWCVTRNTAPGTPPSGTVVSSCAPSGVETRISWPGETPSGHVICTETRRSEAVEKRRLQAAGTVPGSRGSPSRRPSAGAWVWALRCR